MATTWPALVVDDVISGRGAKTVGQKIFDQQQALKRGRNTDLLFVGTLSTSSASYVTLVTMRYRVPEYALAGDEIEVTYWLRVTGAGPTANWRLNSGATNGADSPGVTTTTFGAAQTSIVVQAGWPGTIIDLNVQVKTSSGTAELNAENMVGNLRIKDA